MLSVLRRRTFALLWSGGLLSLVGDWALLTGLPLVVYQLTNSTFALGAAVFAYALPRVLVGSVAGVFVDRWDRRHTMLVCNLLLGAGLLPLLLVRSAEDMWLVFSALFVESTIAQFYRSAEGALVPNVLEPDELVGANALNGFSMNAARLVGPAVGGVLVAVSGLRGVAFFDAGSFFVAALTVLFARISTDKCDQHRAHPVWRDWLAGLHIIWSERIPRGLFLFVAVVGVGEGLIATLFVPFATRVMHGNEFTYGALLSAQAAGGLVGSLLVGHFGQRTWPALLLGAGAILLGLIDLAIFYAPLLTDWMVVPLGLMACVGIPAAALITGQTTLIQTGVADSHRGRLFGSFFATMALSSLIGTVLAGALGDIVGIIPLLTLDCLGYVCGGLFVLAYLRPDRVPPG
jgi:MFS family permease